MDHFPVEGGAPLRTKLIIVVMLQILVFSIIASAFIIRPVRAAGPYYIRANGAIEPAGAPIATSDNITYILTNATFGSIYIERSNIVFLGNNWAMQGSGSGVGIDLNNVGNVTVENMFISGFQWGIYIRNSNLRNYILQNLLADQYGIVVSLAHNNIISDNTVVNCSANGIYFSYSTNNTILRNNLETNYVGISIQSSSNNQFYHNNLIRNSYLQASVDIASQSPNTWDDGYPSGGNYWSDYNGNDVHGGVFQNETGADGVGDTPYTIDATNIDHYPLMSPSANMRFSWPTFHHDSTLAGYTESPAPTTNRKAWSNVTGGEVYSSPAVAYGKVYVGSFDKKIYCFDAFTGKEIWSYMTGDLVYSSPAVAYGKVYVGSNDNRLYCLDAYVGIPVWNYTTGGYVFSSPVVADGKVYFGSWDSKVYCLDATTGARIWSYMTGGYIRSSPCVVGGRIYLGSADQKVYCLDASTGTQIWNYATGGSVFSSPAVVNGKVYVGSNDNRLYCLDAFNGRQIWNYTAANYVDSSPAVAYGKVYVGSWDSNVHCLDALTGTQIWNYTTGGWTYSSPAVADGKVYVGSLDNKVYCLDATSGTQIWAYSTNSSIYSSPAVSDGMVFIGSFDFNIYVFGDTIRVPEDYKTIQAAINAATPRATIWIAPGVYSESLVINKTITLIGKMGSEPIFNGGGSGIAIKIVSTGSGSIVAGIVITSWDQGIVVVDASSCKVYDNIMSLMNQNAIALQGSQASNNLIYSNIFQQDTTAVNLTSSSTGNAVYNNIISSSGIGIDLESNGNVVYGNMITENSVAINILNSNNNKFFHNDFVSNSMQLSISASTGNVWDDGYPSGGNYWAIHVSVDSFSGPQQNIPGSDGIVDVPFTVATNNVDHYPLLKPFGLHNIGIAYVLKSKTVIAQSFTLHIDAKIQNLGMYDETFTFNCLVNVTILLSMPISLLTRNCTTLTIDWNTTNFAKGIYTLTVGADPVVDETDTTDNSLSCKITVTIPGDVNGDFTVDIYDAITLAGAFNTNPSSSHWNSNADINCDNFVDIYDAIILASHFNQHYP
jgi:parallel beta-helix repeat protein